MEEIARRIKGSHFQEENDGIRKIIGFDRATFSRSLNEEGRIEKMERKMPNMQFGKDGGSKPEKKKTTEHGIRKMETFVRKHR
jgi:hypothetical protein